MNSLNLMKWRPDDENDGNQFHKAPKEARELIGQLRIQYIDVFHFINN